MHLLELLAVIGLVGFITVSIFIEIYTRRLDIWLLSYFKHRAGLLFSKRQRHRPKHIIFCFIDHFEPKAISTVDKWVNDYPKVATRFRDADGFYPKHTFFYPIEQYNESYLGQLSLLCSRGFGEIEVHLHHDNDTSDNLKITLEEYKLKLSQKGLLGTNVFTGNIQYGFVHGNHALDNSRADGRWCGVNDEILILKETGCYADFTLPSAPSDTQTKKINSIYYAVDDPDKPKSHNNGVDVEFGKKSSGDLMIIQGPLALSWKKRKYGFIPRIENADINLHDPSVNDRIAMRDRVDLWVKQDIKVLGRDDCIFVKISVHGASQDIMNILFNTYMEDIFAYLGKKYNDGKNYILHYVTAREMYNIVRAFGDGKNGNPNDYRNYLISAPRSGSL
jgi:hypothetical protein